MSADELIAGLGKEWLIVMGICFVGILYWAFRPGRPRQHRDDGKGPPEV